MKKKCDMSRLCSEKSWSEPTALNLWNPGCPEYDLYEKTKIFQFTQEQIKVRCHETPGTVKAQGRVQNAGERNSGYSAMVNKQHLKQHAKKVVSDSLGLVDFAIRLVNSVFNLPDRQVTFFEEFDQQKNCKINSASQKVFWASWNDVRASKCWL